MRIRRWFASRPETGAAMVEYGLIVALIAVVCLWVLGSMGFGVFGFFDSGALHLPSNGPLAPSP